MQKIKDWLSGTKNFIIGRAIYRACISADDDLIKLLDKGFTPYSHQQLINAMQDFIEPVSAPKLTPELIENQYSPDDDEKKCSLEITSNIKSKNEPLIDPAVLKAIDAEWQIPYKKMQSLITQLDQFGHSNSKTAIAKRKEMAEKILDLEKQVNAIWAKKDQYMQTGTLSVSAPDDIEIPKDPIELASLITRTKKGILNNRIRMQKYPDKPGYAERYQHYKTQYFKITGKQYQEKA